MPDGVSIRVLFSIGNDPCQYILKLKLFEKSDPILMIGLTIQSMVSQIFEEGDFIHFHFHFSK